MKQRGEHYEHDDTGTHEEGADIVHVALGAVGLATGGTGAHGYLSVATTAQPGLWFHPQSLMAVVEAAREGEQVRDVAGGGRHVVESNSPLLLRKRGSDCVMITSVKQRSGGGRAMGGTASFLCSSRRLRTTSVEAVLFGRTSGLKIGFVSSGIIDRVAGWSAVVPTNSSAISGFSRFWGRRTSDYPLIDGCGRRGYFPHSRTDMGTMKRFLLCSWRTGWATPVEKSSGRRTRLVFTTSDSSVSEGRGS